MTLLMASCITWDVRISDSVAMPTLHDISFGCISAFQVTMKTLSFQVCLRRNFRHYGQVEWISPPKTCTTHSKMKSLKVRKQLGFFVAFLGYTNIVHVAVMVRNFKSVRKAYPLHRAVSKEYCLCL